MSTMFNPGVLVPDYQFGFELGPKVKQLDAQILSTLQQAFPGAKVTQVFTESRAFSFPMELKLSSGWIFMAVTRGEDLQAVQDGAENDPMLWGCSVTLRIVERWVADRAVLGRALGGGDVGFERLEVLEALEAGGEVGEMLNRFMLDGVDMFEALAQARALAD